MNESHARGEFLSLPASRPSWRLACAAALVVYTSGLALDYLLAPAESTARALAGPIGCLGLAIAAALVVLLAGEYVRLLDARARIASNDDTTWPGSLHHAIRAKLGEYATVDDYCRTYLSLEVDCLRTIHSRFRPYFALAAAVFLPGWLQGFSLRRSSSTLELDYRQLALSIFVGTLISFALGLTTYILSWRWEDLLNGIRQAGLRSIKVQSRTAEPRSFREGANMGIAEAAPLDTHITNKVERSPQKELPDSRGRIEDRPQTQPNKQKIDRRPDF